MELHSQFSGMVLHLRDGSTEKAVLPWNLEVLTHGVSNPHPKVREALVSLGSHSVMTPVTSPPSLSKTLPSFGQMTTGLFSNATTSGFSLPWPVGTHCHHVVTLHIRLVVIFTFVIELAEEVESHHSIEVNNHSQEANSQNQLGRRKREM